MAAPRTGETAALGRAIRVLVVDDSALMRKLLTAILGGDSEIEVVGAARDPYDAREKIKALSPDVLTLDVEMPRMDGITFLGQLMRLRPMPVVMVSSLTERAADVTLAALELGAFDYVPKPKIDVEAGLEALRQVLIDTVKAAARARPSAGPRPARAAAADGVVKPARPAGVLRTTERLIAIGASTGGTEAIAQVLAEVPPDGPGIVIAQHIPEVFSARFAARLDAGSAVAVSEARDGDQILIGHAYVAPGNRHLRVERSGARYHCRVTADEPVNRHRPSVDVLFRSVAAEAGDNAVGVLLTGMGADGADGLLEMLRAGSATIAQDQETSVVFGMPREAIKRGAAAHVVPLPAVAGRMLALATAARR